MLTMLTLLDVNMMYSVCLEMGFKKYPAAVKVLVVHKQALGKEKQVINQELHQAVSISSFRRWKILFLETHAVLMDPAFYSPRGARRKLLNTHRAYIRQRLDEDPTLFLAEIRDMLENERGVSISISALAVEIRDRMAMTVKIARTVHPNQSSLKRGQYLFDISTIPPECMVFLGMVYCYSLLQEVLIADMLYLLADCR